MFIVTKVNKWQKRRFIVNRVNNRILRNLNKINMHETSPQDATCIRIYSQKGAIPSFFWKTKSFLNFLLFSNISDLRDFRIVFFTFFSLHTFYIVHFYVMQIAYYIHSNLADAGNPRNSLIAMELITHTIKQLATTSDH